MAAAPLTLSEFGNGPESRDPAAGAREWKAG
jgi:hypothetical protein